jgi:hypothetical protein
VVQEVRAGDRGRADRDACGREIATVELGWVLLKDILSPPILLLEVDELLEVFGFFLLTIASSS